MTDLSPKFYAGIIKSTIWGLFLTPISNAAIRRKSKTNLLRADDCGMSFPDLIQSSPLNSENEWQKIGYLHEGNFVRALFFQVFSC